LFHFVSLFYSLHIIWFLAAGCTQCKSLPPPVGFSCCGWRGAGGASVAGACHSLIGHLTMLGSLPWTVGSLGAPVQQQSLQRILHSVAGLCCKLALTTSYLVNDCTDVFMPSLNQLSHSPLLMRSLSGHSFWDISFCNATWMLNPPWRCPD
jgi:hypothetical protein